MLNQIITGTVTGTGAVLPINIGFKPKYFKISRRDGSGSIEYYSHFADGAGILSSRIANGVLQATTCSMGSTKDQVANTAFLFQVNGVSYVKAAVAAGTAPTATTVPKNKWGLFGFAIGADGTLDPTDAADNATGYASEALALAAKPSAAADHVFVMYVTVMCTEAAGFIGATTNFDATGVTANFYAEPSTFTLTSTGITPIDNGTACGVSVGIDGYVNVSGAVLDYVAQY